MVHLFVEMVLIEDAVKSAFSHKELQVIFEIMECMNFVYGGVTLC